MAKANQATKPASRTAGAATTAAQASAQAAAQAAPQAKANASTAASRAANPLPNMAATATGNTLGKQQKLVYASGTTALALVPGAARGAQQRAHLATLQAAFGANKAMGADALVAAMAAANVPNPRRVYRRSIRAGILVVAS